MSMTEAKRHCIQNELNKLAELAAESGASLQKLAPDEGSDNIVARRFEAAYRILVRVEEIVKGEDVDPDTRDLIRALELRLAKTALGPIEADWIMQRYDRLLAHYRMIAPMFMDEENETQLDDLEYRDHLEDFRLIWERSGLPCFDITRSESVLRDSDDALRNAVEYSRRRRLAWLAEMRITMCRTQPYRWWWFLDDEP
jgi:hypothetical protein